MTKTIIPTTAYRRYLLSDSWQSTRRRKLATAGFRCEQCGCEWGAGISIDVHHKTYANLGHEPDEDLMVLCRACHGELHGKLAPRLADMEPECHQ